MLTKLLRGKELNIDRENFIWNLIAGGVNASESIVMMMVITRLIGTASSGILNIAFAVGNLLMNIGKFGVRNYQVTDAKRKYSFETYYSLRILSVAMMLVAALINFGIKVGTGEYEMGKALVVLFICLIYCIESYEDVYLGKYQQEGRLDIASKIFIIRWIMTMLVFVVVSLITKNLVISTLAALITTLVFEIILIYTSKKIFDLKKISFTTDGLKSLIKQCFALFISMFATFYVTNAPKYAIDKYMDETTQGYFGYIAMAVFVIELLNNFLYQPQMVALSEEWSSRNIKALNHRAARQYLLIAAITVVCLGGAYLIGPEALTIIFGDDVTPYRKELCVIVLAGGALAYVGYTSVLLTIMRKQKFLLYGMIFISLLALIGFGRAVQSGGMMGVSVYYLIIMVILVIYNVICINLFIHKVKNESEVDHPSDSNVNS